MAMRTLTIGLGIAAAVGIGSQGLLGQTDDTPFHVRGERGELVHVLPAPELVQNKSDRNEMFAAPSDTLRVFSASYGSGNLIDHGGLEIANAQVQPIFWSSAVFTDSNASQDGSIGGQIEAFLERYGTGSPTNYPGTVNTSDFSIVQQYGSHAAIGPSFGVIGGYVDVSHNGVAPPASFSDTQIQGYLAGLFGSSHGAVSPAADVVYGIYFPPGMKVTLSNSASCTSFCGYHNHFTYNGVEIKYAVFPYLNCTGCTISGLKVADMLTIVSSHEIRESVTDPGDNNVDAWYDRRGYEADDKCAWHNLYTMTIGGANSAGGFWVQPEYSNGGTVTRSGFTATYPGPGCVVPNAPSKAPTGKHGG
jgi:hypothetical protein